jgi:hypothetical protein
MKKSLMIIIGILMLSFVAAQEYKLGIEIKESFLPEEPITFKINIFDSSNNILPGEINVEIEDAQKITKIERTVSSGEINTVNIENARAGYWTISAVYHDSVVKEFFSINESKGAKFEIEGDVLIVKNTGNSRYTETIDIIIGDSLGTKNVDLGVGEETRFRLIAPDGTYNIKISDGTTTIAKSNIALTGNVIGILDEKIAESKGSVTGGLRPDENAGTDTYYSSTRNKSFVYVFILVVIGAAVLLAIERNYRRRI